LETFMTVRMLQRRGTASQWNSVGGSVVLQSGEVGINTTNNAFKIGDGSSVWNDLEYHYPDNINEGKYAQLATDNVFDGNQEIGGDLSVDGSLTIGEVLVVDEGVEIDGNLAVDGTISSNQIDVNNNKIIGLADPTSVTDAANKKYVDEVAQGLSVKPAVHAATTANLSGTYNNGAAGVGATLNLGTSATLSIDGETSWSQYDGVLVKNQTDAAENGRYYVSQVGSSSVDWILTRCGYCDTANEIPSAYVFVQGGNTFASTGWIATVDDIATFTVGTDDIVWTQFSGAGTYLAGDGLTISGTTFSVGGTADRISVSSDSIDIASGYVGQTSITTVSNTTGVTTGVWNATEIAIAKGGTGATTAEDARDNLGLGNSATLDLGTTSGTVAEGNHLHNDTYYTKSLTDELLSGYVHTASSSTIAGTLTANNYDVPVSVELSNTISMNFSSGTGLHTRAASGDIAITASGYRAGATKTLFITADSNARLLSFPGSWIWVGSKPISIAASKTGVLTVTSLGTAEANAVASWVAQI
jgi:hypothetical protein